MLKEQYIKTLLKVGPIANMMISPSRSAKLSALPLVLKWGYVEDNEQHIPFFKHVAKTFKSPIQWSLVHDRRESKAFPLGFANWWLFYLKRLDEVCKEQNMHTKEAANWVADHESKLGLQSNIDLANFAQHLIECYEQWFESE